MLEAGKEVENVAKKQLIMDKALELFAKQGFSATSIQQITDHCGISKGAFYLSFKSKDALILAIIDHFMMKYVSSIDYLVRSEDDKENSYMNFTTYVLTRTMSTLNSRKFLFKNRHIH